MQPHIVQINTSSGGVPKKPIPKGIVTTRRVLGDDWNDKEFHGWPDQALCLFSIELIEELKKEGYPLFPGAMGENFTTSGLDFRKVRIGQRYRAGKDVEFRITKIRKPCQTITVYGATLPKATYDLEVKAGNVNTFKWGRSGYYAEVLREGEAFPGDPLILLNPGDI